MSYLQHVQTTTPTRVWVNNPTLSDSEAAIAAGAIGVTTNPAFCSKLLQTEPDQMRRILDEALTGSRDISAAAERAYHLAALALMEQWLPVYEESGGRSGFVTIQEDPRREEDTDYILEASLRAAQLAPNYMAKVPVTAPGLAVIRELARHGVPICATEVFSLSQYRAVLEVYREASGRSGKAPALYVTHITGITDEYFQNLARAERVDVPADLLRKAGTLIGLAEYEASREPGLPVHRIIGGGARGLEHFTNFVGLDLDVTMNWPMLLDLGRDLDAPAAFERPGDEEVALLEERLPNFRRAIDPDGLEVDEFADFGPVMLFRTQFMNGYSRLLDAVAEARRGLLVDA